MAIIPVSPAPVPDPFHDTATQKNEETIRRAAPSEDKKAEKKDSREPPEPDKKKVDVLV